MIRYLAIIALLLLAGCAGSTDDGAEMDTMSSSSSTSSSSSPTVEEEPTFREESVFESTLRVQTGEPTIADTVGCEQIPVGFFADVNAGTSLFRGIDYDRYDFQDADGANYTMESTTTVDWGWAWLSEAYDVLDFGVAGPDDVLEGNIPSGSVTLGFTSCGPTGGDLKVYAFQLVEE